MKKCLRALLLVTIAALMLSPIAMAQDALSVILPAPWTTRTGTQLIYFYEDGANLGARGSFQSFLTITNTSITGTAFIHFQFYQIFATTNAGLPGATSCQELFDFVDVLPPGQRFIFDPKGIRRPSNFGGGAIVGTATDGRYILTATQVRTLVSTNLLAESFNWLTGQIWVNDIGKSATWMTNAVSRMGVDRFGNPLPDYTLITGPAIAGTIGNANYLWMFRPQILAVNSFFRTTGAGAVQAGVPFGNRLTIMSWADQYYGVDPIYKILPATATLTSFVFDDQENAFSVPPRQVTCLQEWVIAPDVAGAAGNFPDFLGPALTSAVASTGGWLRIRVTMTNALQNVLGWFSQYLGTFGGGDFLIGFGRQGVAVAGAPDTPLLITNTNAAGQIVTTTSQQ